MKFCPRCGRETQEDTGFCSSCGASLLASSQDSSPGNEKKCSFCSKPFAGNDAYYFQCRYCDQEFCSDHRLPENHLCKSDPIRRNIPTTSMPYYSTSGGGYSSSSYSRGSGRSFLNVSKQGRNLAGLIVAGLILGFVFSVVEINGDPLVFYLVQVNALVYGGWYLPILTSMIIVLPSALGLVDVFFNAISVIFVDRLLSSTYSPRQYYAVFGITGIAGNLLSLLNGPNIISFGASGGIFGLVAGAVTSDYALGGRINRSLVAWFVFIFIYSSFAGSVDLLAHLGGAVVGLPAGYFVGRSRRTRTRF